MSRLANQKTDYGYTHAMVACPSVPQALAPFRAASPTSSEAAGVYISNQLIDRLRTLMVTWRKLDGIYVQLAHVSQKHCTMRWIPINETVNHASNQSQPESSAWCAVNTRTKIYLPDLAIHVRCLGK
jgi:hypothetical protein